MASTDVIVFRDSIARVVRAITDSGLRVFQRGSKAYVSYDKHGVAQSVTLPAIPDNASREFIASLQGFLDHEVSHVLHTDSAFGVKRARESDKLSGAIWNVVEDIFIERRMGERFKGSRVNLENFQHYAAGKLIPEILEKAVNAGADTKKITSILLPSALRALGGQEAFVEFMKDKWHHFGVHAAKLKPLAGAISAVNSTQDAWKVADEIKAILQPPSDSKPDDGDDGDDGEKSESKGKKGEDPAESKSKGGKSKKKSSSEEPEEKPEEDEPKEGESEDEPEEEPEDDSDDDSKGDSEDEPEDDSDDDSEGDSEGDSEDEPEGDSDGESEDEPEGESEDDSEDEPEGESEDDSGSESEDEPEGESEDDSDGDSEPPEDDEKGKTSVARALDIDPEEIKQIDDEVAAAIEDETKSLRGAGAYVPFCTDLDYVGPFPREEKVTSWSLDDSSVIKLASESAHVVQSEIERAFKARSATRFLGGQRKGKLGRSTLHRICVGDDRVFKTKLETKNRDIAVELVIDLSGSMDGGKIEYASAAAYMMANVFEKLNLAFEITGFTTIHNDPRLISAEDRRRLEEAISKEGRHTFSRYEPIALYVLKDFNSRFNDERKKVLGYLPEMMAGRLLNNVDGESIQKAAVRLIGRKEIRKIMIVLSDGSPAAYGDKPAMRTHLLHTIEEIERTGVEVYGLGLQDRSVTHFYKKSAVIERESEIPSRIIEMVGQIINA